MPLFWLGGKHSCGSLRVLGIPNDPFSAVIAIERMNLSGRNVSGHKGLGWKSSPEKG